MEPHLHGKPIEEYVIEAEEMLGQIAELEATCEKQSEHISKLGKQITDMEEAASLDAAQKFLFREFAMKAESDLDVIQAAWCDFDAVVDVLKAERDNLASGICPVCMTWSWAPCDEGDEGAEQRGEEWALCQCCNDSRIAVLWKEKYDAAFTGLLGASRGECVDWGRKDRQPEIDKLREALKVFRNTSRATAKCGCSICNQEANLAWRKVEAILGKGDGG